MKDNLEIWDDIFKQKEWGKYPPIPLIKFVARKFYSAPNKKAIKILELGSGTGANLWFIAREGFTVYGIDGSSTACDIALKRLNDEHLNPQIGSIVAGDYLNLLDSFENEYFDAIIDVESLYCNSFDKTKEIIEKSFEKIKPKGFMFSFTFADGTWGTENEDLIGYNAVMPKEGPLGNTGYGRFTTKEDIDKLYKLDNNEIINIERQDLSLMNGKIIKEWIIEVQKD